MKLEPLEIDLIGCDGLINCSIDSLHEDVFRGWVLGHDFGGLKLDSADEYGLFLLESPEWTTVSCTGRVKRNFEHFIDIIAGEADALGSQTVIDSAVISNNENRSVKVGGRWDI